MRVLGIIPARGGSKGIPKKNIKILGDKPLIAYTLEAVKKSRLVTEFVVSTEDEQIKEVVLKLGFKSSIDRPKALASDKSPTIDTVIHVLEFFKLKGIEFDAVCLLQVTNPFRTFEFIDKAIEKFKQSKTDSLVSVLKVPHEFNPHWVFEENSSGNIEISTGEQEIISRRQDLPTAFYRDGSIYITKTSVILNKKSLYGNTISYIESDITRHVNIDTMEDWKKAEELLFKLEL